MKLTDQEKLALVTEAVQDMKKSKLSNFAFCIVVGAIVDQPEVSLDDLAWGAKQLAAIRKAVEHRVQTDGYTSVASIELEGAAFNPYKGVQE